jgi:hypothetical protein
MGKLEYGRTVLGRLQPTASACWPNPRPRWLCRPSHVVRSPGVGDGAVYGASPLYAVPRGLRRKHEWPWWRMPGKVRRPEAHLSSLAAWRHGGAATRWDFGAAADLRQTTVTSWWSYNGVGPVEMWRRDWIKTKPIWGWLSSEGVGDGGDSIKSRRAG